MTTRRRKNKKKEWTLMTHLRRNEEHTQKHIDHSQLKDAKGALTICPPIFLLVILLVLLRLLLLFFLLLLLLVLFLSLSQIMFLVLFLFLLLHRPKVLLFSSRVPQFFLLLWVVLV